MSGNVILGLGVAALIPVGLWLKFIIPRIIKRNNEIRNYGKWIRGILGDPRDIDNPEDDGDE